jgi:hypothetical protein
MDFSSLKREKRVNLGAICVNPIFLSSMEIHPARLSQFASALCQLRRLSSIDLGAAQIRFLVSCGTLSHR